VNRLAGETYQDRVARHRSEQRGAPGERLDDRLDSRCFGMNIHGERNGRNEQIQGMVPLPGNQEIHHPPTVLSWILLTRLLGSRSQAGWPLRRSGRSRPHGGPPVRSGSPASFPARCGHIDGIRCAGETAADEHYFRPDLQQYMLDEIFFNALIPNVDRNRLIRIQNRSIVRTNAIIVYLLAIFLRWKISPLRQRSL